MERHRNERIRVGERDKVEQFRDKVREEVLRCFEYVLWRPSEYIGQRMMAVQSNRKISKIYSGCE